MAVRMSLEHFELVVAEPGLLPLSETLRAALRLEPGEPVWVELGPGSLSLVPLRAFIEALDLALPIAQLWERIVQRFVTGTLTLLEERGLPIPENLFTLRSGEGVDLQLLHRECPGIELLLSSRGSGF